MIRLEAVRKDAGGRTLFRALDWHLKPQQRVGLIGPNGIGKSTLFRVIAGIVPPDDGAVHRIRGRSVGYLPQEIATLAGTTIRGEARRGLQELLEMGDSLRRMELEIASASAQGEVEHELMEAYGSLQASFEMLGGFGIEHRVEEILGGLGFPPDALDRDCGELSGGWQMRVALARLLLQQPDILLLDEPTNHLDLLSVVWLESFLDSYEGTLVVVSHDRTFLNRLCTHIADLGQGGLTVYTGNFESFVEQASQRADLLARQHANQARRTAQVQRFVDRFRYKASKATQVQSRVKMLAKMEAGTTGSAGPGGTTGGGMRLRFADAPRSGRVVLTLTNVTKRYGDNVIYEGLDAQIVRGQRVALVGPNGAGKSTLLKVLAGAVPFESGARELGHAVRLFYFAQHQVEALQQERTVLQEAMADAGGLELPRVRDLLGAFLFSGKDVDKQVAVLSGGEKNRLALCKLMMHPTNVLLLDEPTNHLDMASRATLEEALAGYGGAVVLISHDRHFIDSIVDEVWEVADGRITPFAGGYTDYVARRDAPDRPEPLPLNPAARLAALCQSTEGRGEPKRRENRRDVKRREAEARQRRKERFGPLRETAEAAEAEVHRIEEALVMLRARQADPDHYQEPEAVTAVAREAAALQAALIEAYQAWEVAALALEDAEAK